MTPPDFDVPSKPQPRWEITFDRPLPAFSSQNHPGGGRGVGGAVLGVQEAASSRLSPEEEPGTAAEAPGRQGIPTRKKTGSKT